MKAFLISLCAPLLLALPAASQLATTTTRSATASRALTPDEQLFTTLIEQVGAAIEKHDMAALGQYLAPEYVHYNPNNSSGNRSEELAYLAKWPTTTVKTTSPVKVNRYGDAAVTVATTVFSGQEGGKAFQNNIQMMIVWVRRDGHWQMAVVQSKIVPV
ncbi:MAG: nuclear transport factor 2 family protein [Janthinobacterium lividum]